MDEHHSEEGEVPQEGEGVDVILGKVEFHQVEALGQRGYFDVERGMQDKQLQRLMLRNKLA